MDGICSGGGCTILRHYGHLTIAGVLGWWRNDGVRDNLTFFFFFLIPCDGE